MFIKTNDKIGELFKNNKYKINKTKKSVIFKLSCVGVAEGQTERKFRKRIQKHSRSFVKAEIQSQLSKKTFLFCIIC